MSLNEQNLTSQSDVEKFGYKQELKRGLTLPMLCAYGINWICPLGPAVIFGFILVDSGGAAPLAYILAGIAMLFTASSYAALVPSFPLAGSAYNYVSKGLSPYIGFILGWAMILDYVFFPTGATMSMAAYVHASIPSISYGLVLFIVALIVLIVNVIGVEIMAKLGFGLLAISMAVFASVIGVTFYYAGACDGGVGTILSSVPFHFSSWSGLMLATSLAVYNFVGFDAVTTLSEEAINPKRDIPRAVYFTVFGCLVLDALLTYATSLPIPNWQELVAAGGPEWVDTAMYQAVKIAGGAKFAAFFMGGYVFAVLVFDIVCTTAAVRLLFGMGRDNLLPKKFFGAIHPKFKTPYLNVILVTSLIVILGMLMTIEQASLLINFGALLGFIGINFTAFYVFYYRKEKVVQFNVDPENKFVYGLRYLAAPLIGFVVCAYLLTQMTSLTHTIGCLWLLAGLVLLAFKTGFFKKLPPEIREE